MKAINYVIKTLFFSFLFASVLIFSGVAYLDKTIDQEYKIKNGEGFNINSIVPITAEYNGARLSRAGGNYGAGQEFEVDLKAFGVIPISTAKVEVVDELQVAVLGIPFGMKIYTKGVLVTDMTDVKTTN